MPPKKEISVREQKRNKRRGELLEEHCAKYNLSNPYVGENCGVSRETVRNWHNGEFGARSFEAIADMLGMQQNGEPQEILPEWITSAVEQKNEADRQRSARINQNKEYGEIAMRIRKSRRLPPSADIDNLMRVGAGDVSKVARSLGYVDAKHMEASAGDLQLYEAENLARKIKQFGADCKILRTYWGLNGTEFTEAQPAVAFRIKPVSFYALENPNDAYGRITFPSVKILSNLIAAVYRLDRKQEKEKRLFQDNEDIQFFSWLMDRNHVNDPFFTETSHLEEKFSNALQAIHEKTTPLKRKLVRSDGNGHRRVGLLSDHQHIPGNEREL